MIKDSEKLNILVSKYDSLIKKEPKNPKAYYCLGRVKMNLAKYKEAQEDFEKAISIDPNYTLAKVGLIVANVFRRRFVQAVNLYTQYRMDISLKSVFIKKVIRGVSEFYYYGGYFNQKSREISNPLFYRLTIQPLCQSI